MNDRLGNIASGDSGDPIRKRRDGESHVVWPLVVVAIAAMVVSAAADDHGSGSRSNRLRTRPNSQDKPSTVTHASMPQDGPLVREGELWQDELGHILMIGQRYAFRPIQGGRSVMVLENLNLQRIVQRLDEATQAPIWSVSGVVTEFQGSNFLLIERAIRKGQASLRATGNR